MTRLWDNRLLAAFALVVLATLGALGLAIVGVVATLGALVGGGAVVQTFGAFVLGTLLLVGLDIVAAVVFVRGLAERASLPANRRVADGLERIESVFPGLASLGLSETFTPSVESRHEALTRRYVEGELSEAAYERELQALLSEETPEPVSTLETDTEQTPSAETDREREPASE